MRIVRGAVFVSAFFVTTPVFAATCESIAALKLPATTITAAQVVPAGAFKPTPPPSAAALKPFESLPAFCRVQGVIQPSSDSHVEFEVWMPMAGWNGKYFGVGNGGFGGSIVYTTGPLPGSNMPGLREALIAGYAASSTDTGHEAGKAMQNGRWDIPKKSSILVIALFTKRQRSPRRSSERSMATVPSMPTSTTARMAGVRP